ncbi:MAG: hypothetical protein PHH82_03705 [Candidatus ainarchaeum sp.]|nr:hypothetical protein [Candidatus ainarchaeum sp.]
MLLSLINKEMAITFLISNVIIDIDHIINYFYYYRDLNIITVYNHYMFNKKSKKHKERQLYIFHTLEAVAIFSLIGFYINTNIGYGILAGLLFHILCDATEVTYEKIKQETVRYKPLSIIYYLAKYYPRKIIEKIKELGE